MTKTKTTNDTRRNADDRCGADGRCTEREAWTWAVAEQGYTGDLADWLDLDDDEREEYEAGARGEGTMP